MNKTLSMKLKLEYELQCKINNILLIAAKAGVYINIPAIVAER